METVFSDLQKAIDAERSALDRLQFLKDAAFAEFRRFQTDAERLEIFTEEQAAAKFGIKESMLADWRRRYDLPHIAFGKFPRYTKSHLIEIAQILEVRKQKTSVRRAA
jgi:hypothetical protein